MTTRNRTARAMLWAARKLQLLAVDLRGDIGDLPAAVDRGMARARKLWLDAVFADLGELGPRVHLARCVDVERVVLHVGADDLVADIVHDIPETVAAMVRERLADGEELPPAVDLRAELRGLCDDCTPIAKPAPDTSWCEPTLEQWLAHPAWERRIALDECIQINSEDGRPVPGLKYRRVEVEPAVPAAPCSCDQVKALQARVASLEEAGRRVAENADAAQAPLDHALYRRSIEQLAAKVHESNADTLREQLAAARADVRDLCTAIAPGNYKGDVPGHVERAKQTRAALLATNNTPLAVALAEGNMLPD